VFFAGGSFRRWFSIICSQKYSSHDSNHFFSTSKRPPPLSSFGNFFVNMKCPLVACARDPVTITPEQTLKEGDCILIPSGVELLSGGLHFFIVDSCLLL
jgi:hypothetical protein